MHKLLTLIIVCCTSFNGIFSQNISKREYFLNYFENNYPTLNEIEGLYNVNLNVDEPPVSCNNCVYSKFTIDNYDEVAIIRKNGRFEMNSLKMGVVIGYIEERPDKYGIKDIYGFSQGSGVKMKMIVKNYPDQGLGGSFWGDELKHGAIVSLNDMYNIFEKSITNKLILRCPGGVSEILEGICLAFDVDFNYQKVYPHKDFIPEPKKFTGTGFLLNSRGYVITNYHVLKTPQTKPRFYYNKEIVLYNEANGLNLKGDLICFDEDLDLAVIKIDSNEFISKNYKPLKVNPKRQSMGTSVSTIGYPFGEIAGNNMKYTKGYISSESGPQNSQTLYTIDLSINPGNSGGPLLDELNSVVGIVNARLNEDAVGAKVENIGFAIKTDALLNFLKKNKINYQLLAPEGKYPASMDEIKKGIFMIEHILTLGRYY